MKILNNEEINSCVTPLEVLEAVEKAFLLQESGEFIMPDRMHVESDDNVLLLMPAFNTDYFSTKLVSVFPDNKKLNKPAIYGSVMLNDGKTGEPLALLNGSTITALRTGAVGGMGIAYTTPKSVSKLGLIGAGYQGYHQVLFACVVRNIEQVSIYDPYHKEIESFKKQLSELLPHIEFVITKDATQLVSDSDVIITATTSQKPVIEGNKAILEGKHFIGLGSYQPEMRELPEALIPLLNEIVVDTDHAKHESGDVSIPLSKGLIKETNIIRLGELINKKKSIDSNRTTFFKTVGMALFDLLTAQMIYKKAIEKGIGTDIDF